MRCSTAPTRRSARSTCTTRTRSPSRPTRDACARASRARTCSASCTRSSGPTRPTSRTSCCRRPRSSSSSTCTRRTGTCTRSRTIRRSRRWARRCPTPRSSAVSPRAWASPSPASAIPTRRWPAPRGSATTPRRATSTSTRCCATDGSASTCPPCTRRSRRAIFRRRRASANSRVRRWPRRARIPCPTTCRRASRRPAIPSSQGATRWRSSRRPRATS